MEHCRSLLKSCEQPGVDRGLLGFWQKTRDGLRISNALAKACPGMKSNLGCKAGELRTKYRRQSRANCEAYSFLPQRSLTSSGCVHFYKHKTQLLRSVLFAASTRR